MRCDAMRRVCGARFDVSVIGRAMRMGTGAASDPIDRSIDADFAMARACFVNTCART